jgi:hypothetical protein
LTRCLAPIRFWPVEKTPEPSRALKPVEERLSGLLYGTRRKDPRALTGAETRKRPYPGPGSPPRCLVEKTPEPSRALKPGPLQCLQKLLVPGSRKDPRALTGTPAAPK